MKVSSVKVQKSVTIQEEKSSNLKTPQQFLKPKIGKKKEAAVCLTQPYTQSASTCLKSPQK